MKKISQAMLCFVMVVIVIVTATTPALAASGAMYANVSEVQSSWKNGSEMIESDDAQMKQWAEYWIKAAGAKTEDEKARALYDAVVKYMQYDTSAVEKWVNYNGQSVQVKNIPNADLGYFVTQKSALTCLKEISSYINNGGSKPKGLCGDFARLYAGLLRSVGIPAYVEIGVTVSGNTYIHHARTVLIEVSTMRAYTSDTCYGASSGNASKYYKMTSTTYKDNYTRTNIYAERTPSKTPTVYDTNTVKSAANLPKQVAVNIPAQNRYSGTQFDKPTVKLNLGGDNPEVYMNLVYYGGNWWLTAVDICMILDYTSTSINVEWMDNEGTVEFTRGEYRMRGTESNWTNGTRPELSMTAQAYKTYAWFEGDETNIEILLIKGQSFARLDQVANMLNFAGSSLCSELGGSFKIIG